MLVTNDLRNKRNRKWEHKLEIVSLGEKSWLKKYWNSLSINKFIEKTQDLRRMWVCGEVACRINILVIKLTFIHIKSNFKPLEFYIHRKTQRIKILKPCLSENLFFLI